MPSKAECEKRASVHGPGCLTPNRPTRVALVCSGLGHVCRGFETFTRECFDALRSEERLDIRLFKGAGPAADKEKALWCLRRNGTVARWLAMAVRRDSYFIEQATFTLSLLPNLAYFRPDVVFFSDGAIGNLLWRWRRLTRARYKLLFSNGGPLGSSGFPRFDHIHQVSEVCHEESLKAGRPPATQTLLPYGFTITPHFRPPSPAERQVLRRRLRLADRRPVVLTVGAINRSHKRMDYVVREVAALPTPRPFLLMLGQPDEETPAVLKLAEALLGPDGYRCQTVAAAVVADYYDACDLFVLASLSEGFGRVYVEALAHGLPCLAHDYPGTRFILGDRGFFGDFSRSGALAELMRHLYAGPSADPERQGRHQAAYDRFSWDRLRDRYVRMIEECAREPAAVETALRTCT